MSRRSAHGQRDTGPAGEMRSGRPLRGVPWMLGWPLRALLLLLVRGYRVTLGQVAGGSCRFYPSCSSYAEDAVSRLGAVRGGALALWRVLRCSPLSSGGVDHPPLVYDNSIHERSNATLVGLHRGGPS